MNTENTSLQNGDGQKHNLPEFSITVETLPSKSLSYPEHALIKYRVYTYGEIHKTTSSKIQTKDALELIVSGIEVNFKKYDLTLSDSLYLGLMRKISTLGTEKIKVPYRCARCNQLNELIFKNNELKFNDIEAPELPVRATFESNNKEYHFMPLTLGNYFKLVDEKLSQNEIALKAALCTNHPYEQVYKDFDTCSNINDMQLITEIDELLDHGLKPLEAICEKTFEDKPCKQKVKLRLEGRQSLLLPFRERDEPVRSRISFGKASKHKPNRPGSDGLSESKKSK